MAMSLLVTPHRATTRHLASCYLFQAGRRFDVGPVLGLDARSGSVFCFEPFGAYAAGLITNPNLLILGEVGSGKSTVAKLLCWAESALLGRSVAILDPKGEYGPLADLLGLERVRLEPGGKTRLNIFDATAIEGDAAETRRRHAEILGALISSGLGRPLRGEERAALDAAIEDRADAPSLQNFLDALLEPSGAMAATLATDQLELARSCRELAFELRRLVAGDLAGMFDGKSTVDLHRATRGLHLDLSPVYANAALLAPTMVAAGSWLTGALARPGRQYVLVLDETWQVLADPGIGRWLRSTMKLARALGAAVVLVTHSLGDFRAVGDERSEAARVAASLVADTGACALLPTSRAASPSGTSATSGRSSRITYRARSSRRSTPTPR
jgi:type IV secretory pathway VirB4 component